MAKEGIVFVVIPFVLGLIFLLLRIPYFSYIFAVIFYVLVFFFAFFFRDPNRKIVAEPHEFVSPVDGKVLDVKDEGDQNRIVIFLSIFDVHVARQPYSGKLEDIEYFKGKFLPAYREKASELNERVTLTVDSSGFKYSFRLIAGVAARRIKMWVNEGETLKTGEKIGIIFFGSRAEIFLPKTLEVLVKKDDKVHGGLTSIAKKKSPE